VATSVLLEAALPDEIPPTLPTVLLPDRIGSGLLPSPAIESDMRYSVGIPYLLQLKINIALKESFYWSRKIPSRLQAHHVNFERHLLI